MRGGGGNISNYLEKITLIEPSSAALHRAEINLQSATNKRIQIKTINQKLPSNNTSEQELEIQYQYQNVIHLFSNILDICEIDLLKLARLVAKDKRKHYVLCVGPLNKGKHRIDDFCSLFGAQEFFSSIEQRDYSRLSNNYPITCKTKCFLYDNTPLQTNYVPTQDNIESLSTFDECDYYGFALENGWISKVFYDVYKILSKLQEENPNISLLVKPSINGANPNFILMIPKGGIFIINICEKDLREYEFEKDKDNKINYKILVNNNNEDLKIQSPSGVLYDYKDNILEILVGIDERMLYDENLKNAVKIMPLFTDETTRRKMGKMAKIDFF